jgi:hypothetical protein
MRDRRAFLFSFLGTVAGGLVLAGILGLIRVLADVDFFSIFFFGIMPLVILGGALLIHFTGRSVENWAARVDERLDALEARSDATATQGRAGEPNA